MLTFGTDPELFLAENSRPVPAVGLIGGTKEKPFMYEQYGFQEDNVMGEYTVPVTSDPFYVVDLAREGARLLMDFVRTKHQRTFTLYRKPVATFTDEVMAACGQQGMQFGCSPDFDAYRMGAQWEPFDPAALRKKGRHMRFAGGHIHIGYKEDVPNVPEYVAALMCDLTIGASLVSGGEQQAARREWYGLPGRFRPTAYGLEYRTPSNQWLYSAALGSALSGGLDAFNRLMQSGEEQLVRLYNEVPWNDLRKAITEENSGVLCELGRWLNGSYDSLALPYGG